MKRSYQFCLSLLKLGRYGQRNLVNMLLGLCSSPQIHSVVELTESEFFQYSYSSTTKVLTRWDCSHIDLSSFLAKNIDSTFTLSNGVQALSFTHDFTKALKPESHTLEDRTYLATNNAIGGRKSISAGYHLAALHFDSGQSGHNPLLSLKRLDGHENHIEVAKGQVDELVELLQGYAGLTIVKADSHYGRGAFLSKAYEHDNLMFVCRIQSGVNVYTQYKGTQKGANSRIFGDTYTLISKSGYRHWVNPMKTDEGESPQTSIHELPCDEVEQIDAITQNGRKIVIKIKRWNNMLFRSTKGIRMSDKPFDVFNVEVTDAQTGESIFMRPMWLCAAGKRKAELSCNDVYGQYRSRYGVEPTYRFCNQKLLMGSLQTPCKEHLDTWLKIIQITTWYLYLVADEAKLICKEWQKYLEKNKNAKVSENQNRLTLAQAYNSAKSNICLYDLRPFAPMKVKSGTGRLKGTKMPPRERHRILKKAEAVAKYASSAT